MEEIGNRTTVFSLEGLTGSHREYIAGLLASCAVDKVTVDDVLGPAAVDLLASRLRTPLQIEQHLTLAFETGCQASEKPISGAIVDSVLSKWIDDLEPTLIRHAYTAKVLAEMGGIKQAEIKAMCKHNLEADRARDLKEKNVGRRTASVTPAVITLVVLLPGLICNKRAYDANDC